MVKVLLEEDRKEPTASKKQKTLLAGTVSRGQ